MVPYLLGVLASFVLPELHVVAPHEAPRGAAVVTVDRPGKDVVLLVGAHYPTEWDIRPTPRTKLLKVLIGGYWRQTWKELPGVDVREMSVESVQRRARSLALHTDYRAESMRLRLCLQDARHYIGLEVASFYGAYRPDPAKPIVVNAVSDDERLRGDSPRPSPAAEIPPLKFDAAELIDAGEELALVVHCEHRDWNDYQSVGSFLYVIDPKTGAAKLAWKE